MQLQENIQIFNETPFSLNQPFKQNQNIILAETYLLEYQQGDKCLILVPSYIQKQIPIIVYQQKADSNQFDNAYLNIEYNGPKEITTEQFKEIRNIHYKFLNIVLFKLDENAQNIFRKFFVEKDDIYNINNQEDLQKRLYKDFRFKNYLFLPVSGQNKQVDIYFEIQQYNKNYQKILEIQKSQIDDSSDVYQNELLGKIYYSKNDDLKNPFFVYLYNIGQLSQFTLQDYLNILSQTSYRYLNEEFSPEYFIQKIDNYYNLQFALIKQKSLDKLIQSNFGGISDNKEFNFLSPFYELCLQNELNSDVLTRNYILGVKLPKSTSLDFQKIENFEKTFVEKDPYRMLMERTLDPEMIQIYRSDEIQYQGFECNHYNGWVKNLALLKTFERSVLIHEMNMYFKLDYIEFSKILLAMTPKQMFKQMNYENYETIGDSILKFFTIIYAIKKYPNKDEGQISELKSRLVSNLNLRKAAIKFGYHYFMKAFDQNILDYIPPQYSINEEIIENKNIQETYLKQHTIGKKAIADQMESLIGAAYYTKQRLFESFIFLKSLQIYTEEENFTDIGKIMFEKIEIDDKIIEITNKNKDDINRNIDWHSLFFMGKKKSYDYYNYKNNIFHGENCENLTIEQHFQQLQNNLGYQYNNVNILVNSLAIGTKTFERLELLGDAVLDLYCQLSLVKIARYCDYKLFPEKIHSLKVFMLSFEPMSLFCYFLDLPKYIEFESQDQYNNVYKFFEDVDINQPVKYLWNKNTNIAPKCVSDVFEAFIGGLFLDQGFDAIKKLLDQPFSNYIYFYVHNFQFILIDIKQYIINQFESHGIQALFKQEKDMVQLVVKGKPIIQYELTEQESVKSLHRRICLEFFQQQDKYMNKVRKRQQQIIQQIPLFLKSFILI